MNAENFAEIIGNPSRLYQISYQELKSLVLQYPYCGNLHHLLLLKSHMEQHRDFERVLEKTATYSIDRRYLYRLMQARQAEEATADSFELGADFLELRDLSELAARRESLPLDALEPSAGEEDVTEASSVSPPLLSVNGARPPAGEEEDAEEFAALAEALRRRPPGDQPVSAGDMPPAFAPAPAQVADWSAWLGILEQWTPPLPAPPPLPAAAAAAAPEPPAPPPPRPQPKSSFSSWVRQYQPAHLLPQLDELMESMRLPEKPHPDKKKKKKTDEIIAFAERSLRMNEEVVSETLAELLVSQERYAKAIQMYERLSLIFPEKSGFFAGKIDQLKKYL